MTHRRFRFGVVAAQAPSGDQWIEKARRIEELGYVTLLMPDRLLGPVFSPIPALATAAAATRSLHVGTFVLTAGCSSPASEPVWGRRTAAGQASRMKDPALAWTVWLRRSAS